MSLIILCCGLRLPFSTADRFAEEMPKMSAMFFKSCPWSIRSLRRYFPNSVNIANATSSPVVISSYTLSRELSILICEFILQFCKLQNPLRIRRNTGSRRGFFIAYFCATGLTSPFEHCCGLPPTCSADGCRVITERRRPHPAFHWRRSHCTIRSSSANTSPRVILSSNRVSSMRTPLAIRLS